MRVPLLNSIWARIIILNTRFTFYSLGKHSENAGPDLPPQQLGRLGFAQGHTGDITLLSRGFELLTSCSHVQ